MRTIVKAGCGFVILAIGALLVAWFAGSRSVPGSPRGSPPVETTGVPTQEAIQFEVRREAAVVQAGPQDPLTELTDSAFHSLDISHRVTTDEVGEALLQSQIGAKNCKVYVFQTTKLIKSPCPQSVSNAGNTVCQEQGSTIYRNCGDHLKKIETFTAEFQVIGSWVEVIYSPDQRLSLILVFEGQALSRPVIDFDARTLGEVTDVPAGYFWFTNPGETADSVAGLAGRAPHAFDQLPPVIKELGLEPWIDRTRAHAEEDAIQFPDWMTCAPGVLYCENFDDDQAFWWILNPSWQIKEDSAGYVLSGREQTWAFLTGHAWDDYHFRFRLKLLEGTVNLNYRLTPAGSGFTGYYIGFNEAGLYLSKSVVPPEEIDLRQVKAPHELGRWYVVEIAGQGGYIQVLVDGNLELDYIDSNPILQGGIAFETLDQSRAVVDDIEILPGGAQLVPPAATPSPECRVIPGTLNILEGPGTDYSTVGADLSRGTRLLPVGRTPDGRWVLVQVMESGQEGWVSAGSDFISCNLSIGTLPSITPTPPATPPPEPTPWVACWPEHTVIEAGECVTLSWDAGNVNSLHLGAADLSDRGNWRECPLKTDTYELSGSSGTGPRDCSMTVEVRDTRPPAIGGVQIEPATRLPPGQDLPICHEDSMRVSTRVTDPSKLAKVELWVSPNCGVLEPIVMTATGDDKYQAYVSAGACLQVRAEDEFGNASQTDLTPPPCRSVQLVYDFVAEAPSADWNSSGPDGFNFGALTWPGVSNEQGFARWLDNAELEDGSLPPRVLETHPHWTDDGEILGYYWFLPVTLQQGDRFVARVGFLEGAEAGNVVFRISCFDGDADTPFQQLAEVEDAYDGELRDLNIELPLKCVGGNSVFKFQVSANGPPAQDWAVWERARIERRQ